MTKIDVNKAIEAECQRFAGAILKLVEKSIKQELSSPKTKKTLAKMRDLLEKTYKPTKSSHLPMGLPPGAKRAAAAIKSLTNELDIFITNNPGLRVEQLSKKLSRETPELRLPLKRLINDGHIGTTGSKRTTTYWPAGHKALKE